MRIALAAGCIVILGCGGSPPHGSSAACQTFDEARARGGRCEIRVGDCCFAEQAAACAAAGCPNACVILESYPGQVECHVREATEATVPGSTGSGCEPCVASGRNWTGGECADACLMDTYCIGPGNPAAGNDCALATSSTDEAP